MADTRIETIGQALKGVFSDPKWFSKSATGAAIIMIPYLGFVWLAGYGLHYQRATAWGTSERLPDWRPVEGQWRTGLYAFVVGMAYSLPLSILLGAGISAMIISLGIVSGGEFETVHWVLYGVSWVVMVVVSALPSLALWPVYVHVGMYDRLDAGFQLSRIYQLARRNSSTFWTLFRRSLGILGMSMALSLLVMAVVVGIGVLLTVVFLRDLPVVALLLIFPLEFLALLATNVVAVPLSLATYRLWAGYARVVYGLDVPSAVAAATV